MGGATHIRRIVKQAKQQRDILAHRLRHRGRFYFAGRPVRLPPRTKLGIRHAIATGSYEDAERDLIGQYLQSDLPVIELGGCLGLVSRVISEKLELEVDHLIVEANPALLDYCRWNAETERRRPKTSVVHKAIAYGDQVVRFHASANAHNSRLSEEGSKSGTIDVPAITLAGLVEMIGDPQAYTLVSDVEGAEFDIFEHDGEALKSCALALVEVHPAVFEKRGQSLDAFLDLVAGCGMKFVDHVEDVYAFAR